MKSLLKIDPLPKNDGGDGTRQADADAGHAPCRARATVAPTAAPPTDGGGTEAPPTDTVPQPTATAPAGADPRADGAADGHRAAARGSGRAGGTAPQTGGTGAAGTG